MLEEENIKELQEELRYWEELGKLVGWTVYGWTFKHSGSYDTGGQYHNSLTLTGKQRDDIVGAIRNAKEDSESN